MIKPQKLHSVYFSATQTTAKYLKAIADVSGIKENIRYDIIHFNPEHTVIPTSECVIFGVPVYAGRIPSLATERIKQFSGKGTPAIIFCTYGNRAYDDALQELKNVVSAQGFKVVSAAALVSQHSIFPSVATGRPSTQDIEQATLFGTKSFKMIETATDTSSIPDFTVPGNNEYRPIERTFFFAPYRDTSLCNGCGLCIRECPTQAIDYTTAIIDTTKCISCGNCISVCPSKAKWYKGLKYSMAKAVFTSKYSKPKASEFFYAG